MTIERFFPDHALDTPKDALESWLRKGGLDIAITTNIHETDGEFAQRITTALDAANLKLTVWRNPRRPGFYARLETK
jgi:hypothetical protein